MYVLQDEKGCGSSMKRMQLSYAAQQSMAKPNPPDEFIVRDPATLWFGDVFNCQIEVCKGGRRARMETHRCIVLTIIQPQLRQRAREALANARRCPEGRTWNAIVPCLELEREDTSEWDAPKV